MENTPNQRPNKRCNSILRLGRLLAIGLVLALMACGALAWVERDTLRAWWVLRGLRQADEVERELWITRVADLGEPAVLGLFDCLSRPNERTCQNAALALSHLAHSWGSDDPRTADLATKLARAYHRFSPIGKACLLTEVVNWLDDKPPTPALLSACARILGESADLEDALGPAIDLSWQLLQRPQTNEAVRGAREVARAGLRSATSANRLRAVRLGLMPGVDLHEEIAGLLRDPEVAVRRTAILAVGPSEQAIRDEGLLPSLHDSDPEVRQIAEEALKGRGLRPAHIALGKLLTHPVPTTRLTVLDYLSDERLDLDVGLWLRRLSHDPSPAVRVAAARMMSEQHFANLRDRLDQMATSDPSPTVAQQAKYYLEMRGEQSVMQEKQQR